MSAAVTLKVTQGSLCGAEFVYRTPTLCTVGRGRDCLLQLPTDDSSRTVSRHHCLLEIDPPGVRVCDLGSLNGTFVNGEVIGKRDLPHRLEPFSAPPAVDRQLGDGDELRVGGVVFRVSVCVEEGTSERVPCIPACEEVC